MVHFTFTRVLGLCVASAFGCLGAAGCGGSESGPTPPEMFPQSNLYRGGAATGGDSFPQSNLFQDGGTATDAELFPQSNLNH